MAIILGMALSSSVSAAKILKTQHDILGYHNPDGSWNNDLYYRAIQSHYQVTPQEGFYCLYRHRAPSDPGTYPDCPPEQITRVATDHARELITAGVDFIAVDASNWSSYIPGAGPSSQDDALNAAYFSDVFEIRPFEVLLEEWTKLRNQGLPTPQVAIFARLSADPNPHQVAFLNAYNNDLYQDLILRERRTGKKIFFYDQDVNHPADPTLLAAVQSNGGRNDVVTVLMSGFLDSSLTQQGMFQYANWCRNPISGQAPWTTSIIGANRTCNQSVTTNSPIGISEDPTQRTSVTVSEIDESGFSSNPFQSSGKMRGLALKKFFAQAFAAQPDYLMLSAWNETIALPLPPLVLLPGAQNTATPGKDIEAPGSVGLEYEPNDRPADSSGLWFKGKQYLDTYGADYSRAFEPSQEEGTFYYDLLTSCLREYRNPQSQTSRSCINSSEACCQLANAEIYTYVYALKKNSVANVYRLTSNDATRQNLKGSGWTETCTPDWGPTDVCTDVYQSGFDGPFIAFNQSLPNTVALSMCQQGSVYYPSSTGCATAQTIESVGFVSTVKNSETARTLNVCQDNAGNRYAWLHPNCPTDTVSTGVLGYVK